MKTKLFFSVGLVGLRAVLHVQLLLLVKMPRVMGLFWLGVM